MPALEIRALVLLVEDYSILSNIRQLYASGRRDVAITMAACSVVYPATKIVALAFLWMIPFPRRWRSGLIRLLRLLGRWSMLDVVAVSGIVVASRPLGFLFNARALPGIYVYAAAIIALMLATVLLDRLARDGA